MAEQTTERTALDAIPEAEVKTSPGGFSLVWLVPLVAAAIGGWVWYKTWSEQGPVITISFETAEGIEAGKTKVRYKDVEIGLVDEVSISEDLGSIVLRVSMSVDSGPYLTDKARFWVVRPRVAAGQVSGLGTLLSGAYIAMDPGPGGTPQRHFTGLEKQPLITADEPGHHYVLQASTLGSLEVGSPVYFRKIKVGQVVDYALAPAGSEVDIKIFVHAPHHQLVRTTTRFWNASGVDVSVGAEGVRVRTESVVSLLLGGIAFETPDTLESGVAAEDGDEFPLYESYESTREKKYALRESFLMYFDGSVRGLSVGAPIEFRGIKVGEVRDINLEYDPDELVFRIPVLAEFQLERFTVIGESPRPGSQLGELVARGLRAQLEMGNLLTGQLYVKLDMFPEAKPAELRREGRYSVLPTVPAPLEQIATSAADILKKLQKVPFDEIGTDLSESIRAAEDLLKASEWQQALRDMSATLSESRLLMSRLGAELPSAAEATLVQARDALAAVNETLGPDAPLRHELRRTLSELSAAARSIRVMTDYLERHPEALIHGKGKRQ